MNGVKIKHNPDGTFEVIGDGKRKVFKTQLEAGQYADDELHPRCEICKWHDAYTWVCFNGDSDQRADITDKDFMCKHYEKKERE